MPDPMTPRACIRHALLIHGAGAGGWEWNLWQDVLRSRGLGTVAPDLRPAPEGLAATTLDHYRRQVRAELEALPRPRAVIGASLGGLLAWLCADLADAVVLINPVPPAPWAARLPARDWPEVVPWRRDARLASTRRAMDDADEAAVLYAFRRWRDESGAVLREAHAGVEVRAVEMPAVEMPAVEMPAVEVPVLCIASQRDDDVAPELSAQFAAAIGATLLPWPSPSHVGPLLGRDAARLAAQAADWLSAR
ncbi:alpha/beta hydrolase [Lysobacter antibioticus]|uniref:alpha/beta hydrolase n=1 Tax=Lysobacter antibioticus TaxID=84531 RepID=UPI0009DE710D|nr:alpha/beta fold hydrolase [Lysobacter antibioticus]